MADRTILGWLLIGLVAGVLAKWLVPGRDPGGLVVTVLIGIAGALLAGFVVQTLGHPPVEGWAGYAGATVGAVVLLLLYRVVMSRRS